MPHCAVLSCKNSTRNVNRVIGDVSFHQFPSDPNVKEKWIDATGQKNWFPSKHSRICSAHFSDSSFTDTKKNRYLTTKAIPTIDVLKTSTDAENIEENLTVNKLTSCNTTSKTKFKMDINETSPSNKDTPINTSMKQLAHKLDLAKQKIKEQNKQIKRLKEQNRRKGLKILILEGLLVTRVLKKEVKE